MCLIPMYLGPPEFSIRKADCGQPLALSPTTRAVDLPEAFKLADLATHGDRLSLIDRSNGLQLATSPVVIMLQLG